jgi:hypothetical protein
MPDWWRDGVRVRDGFGAAGVLVKVGEEWRVHLDRNDSYVVYPDPKLWKPDEEHG